jgi:O-antigen/teichoic acid export membrane protein
MIRLFFAAFALLIVTSEPAHAYLDPGTASIVLQAVVGAVAAAGLFFRTHLYRLFSLFRRTEKAKEGAGASPDGRSLKNDPGDDR